MTKKPALNLQFSHLGIHVTDIDKMATFYKKALIFTQTDSGALGTMRLIFLSRDPSEHHQIVLVTGRPPGLAFNIVNQISFRVPDMDSFRRIHDRLVSHGAADVQPVTHGNALSIYCRDPEGNRLELFLDTPWYCEQPLREPIDLAKSDDEILAMTEAIARNSPRFKPRAEWVAEMASLMEQDQRG